VRVVALPQTSLVIALVLGVAGSFALGSWPSDCTPRYLPGRDADELQLVATWWQARKHIANWWLWILVDAIYVASISIKTCGQRPYSTQPLCRLLCLACATGAARQRALTCSLHNIPERVAVHIASQLIGNDAQCTRRNCGVDRRYAA